MDLVWAKEEECAPNKMPCSCHYCALVAADLQICDLHVRVWKKVNDIAKFRMGHETLNAEDLSMNVKEHIVNVIYQCIEDKKNWGRVSHDNDQYTMLITRLSVDYFVFCFHTKNIEPVPDDADPLPMD
jgi:hypothetical protein